ncbi:MAG: guanylate kinase [Desulfobacteraceae bacterium]|nr:guanylate kinase [Desulfobacteraceae bacterium]
MGAEKQPKNKKGRLFILSAPSGAGKTTLCMAVRQHFPDFAYSISYTTRLPRSGENDGQDYHFISKEEFQAGIQNNRWVEWAVVHEHFYGTSSQWIKDTLTTGKNVLMDIDVQGARQIVARFPDSITIFVMPPAFEELERRLMSRDSDDPDTITVRLKNARTEIAQKDEYNHVLVNDNLDEAIIELISLFNGYITGKKDQ